MIIKNGPTQQAGVSVHGVLCLHVRPERVPGATSRSCTVEERVLSSYTALQE